MSSNLIWKSPRFSLFCPIPNTLGYTDNLSPKPYSLHCSSDLQFRVYRLLGIDCNLWGIIYRGLESRTRLVDSKETLSSKIRFAIFMKLPNTTTTIEHENIIILTNTSTSLRAVSVLWNWLFIAHMKVGHIAVCKKKFTTWD